MKNASLSSDLIPIEAVQERDIDLLLLEEIKCNSNFRNYLLIHSIGLPSKYEFFGAWHSLSQVGLGESDLAFKIKTGEKTILFLIENKISASFQSNQAKRYRKRGQKRKREGECDEFYTLLTAPKEYIIRNDDFDFYFEYEKIRNWFLAQSDLGDRGAYKAEVLEIAIEKLRRGYTPIFDDNATSFWWTYYHFATEHYPHLNMRKPPAGIPKGSSFMQFEPKDIGLRKGGKILHKGYGAVDLQLTGKADQIDHLLEQYSDLMTHEMEFVKTGKSASFRINVEKIDVTRSFDEQREIITIAFEKMNELYHWAKKHLRKK